MIFQSVIHLGVNSLLHLFYGLVRKRLLRPVFISESLQYVAAGKKKKKEKKVKCNVQPEGQLKTSTGKFISSLPWYALLWVENNRVTGLKVWLRPKPHPTVVNIVLIAYSKRSSVSFSQVAFNALVMRYLPCLYMLYWMFFFFPHRKKLLENPHAQRQQKLFKTWVWHAGKYISCMFMQSMWPPWNVKEQWVTPTCEKCVFIENAMTFYSVFSSGEWTPIIFM